MAVFCPYKAEHVLYLECQECENKGICSSKNIFALFVSGSHVISNEALVHTSLDQLLFNAKEKHEKILIIERKNKETEIIKKYAEKHSCLYKSASVKDKVSEHIQNKAIHELLAKYKHRGCVLFWDGKSKDIQYDVELAEAYKTPIRIIKIKT